MVKKLLGYIITAIGLVGFAGTFPAAAKMIGLPAGLGIGILPLTIASLVVIAVGVVLLAKSEGSSKQAKEVPIYEGKNIVGYRRMGK